MTKTFTPNDVVRFLYKETDLRENQQIENAMLCDTDLLDQFIQLEEIKGLLDKINELPSKRIIRAILKYSDSYDPILS